MNLINLKRLLVSGVLLASVGNVRAEEAATETAAPPAESASPAAPAPPANTYAAHMEQARALMQKGDMEGALVALEEALPLNPTHPEVWYRLGTVEVFLNRFEMGVAFIRRSIELDPNNQTVRFSLANLYEVRGDLDHAVEEYQYIRTLAHTAQEKKEANKRLDFAIAKRYRDTKRYLPALQLFNNLLLDHPKDSAILFHAGLLQRAMGRNEQAERLWRDAVRADPRNADPHMALALLYEQTGFLERMMDHLIAVMTLRPGRGGATAIGMAHDVAKRLTESGKADKALAILDRLMRSDNAGPPTFFLAAVIHQAMGRFDLAEVELRRVIELDANNLPARVQLARLYLQTGKIDYAITEFEELVKLDPNGQAGNVARLSLGQIYAARGDAYAQAKRPADALDSYEKSLTYAPDDLKVLNKAGILSVQLEKMEQGRALLERVRAADPNNGQAAFYLGLAYEALNQLTNAVAAYSAAISLDVEGRFNIPRIAEKLVFLTARVFFENGDYRRAARLLRDATDLNPDNLQAHYMLGLIYSRWNEPTDAAREIEAVMRINDKALAGRLMLGSIYEQLWRDREARLQYKLVVNAAEADKAMIADAEARIAGLDKRANGFNYSTGYDFSFNNNTNLSQTNPTFDYSTTINFSMDYNYHYNDWWRMSLNWNPQYTISHLNQNDSLRTNYSPTVTFGTSNASVEVGYTRTDLSTLSRDQSISSADSISLGGSLRLHLPDAFAVFSGGLVNERVLGFLRTRLSYRTNQSEASSFFDADSTSASILMNIASGAPMSSMLGYVYTLNDNTNPIGNDYGYTSHNAILSLNRSFSSTWSGGLTYSLNLFNYTHPDSFSNERRRNMQHSLSLSANYAFNPYVRLSGSYSLSTNRTNLPVHRFITQDQFLSGLQAQSTSLDHYINHIITLGFSANF